MTSYLHSTFSHAGIETEGFITPDGNDWVLPTGFLANYKVHRQTWHDYAKKANLESISVKVGKRGNVRARAYRPYDLAKFTNELAIKGNIPAQALLTANFAADLTRKVKETNGIQVTAAQHEEHLGLVREKLIAEYIQGYQRIQEIKETMTTFSTLELDTIREKRNTIFFEQMTVLEKEVAKELQMDIEYPGWRDDEEPATLVTNRQGLVELNPDQAAWYQRQQQDVLNKRQQKLQG